MNLSVPRFIRAFAALRGLSVQITAPDHVTQCRQLLYRVYHEEMGWTPPLGNPSGLRLNPGPPGRMVDDFDEGALWIGVYRGPTLVACSRVLLPQNTQPLEVALYSTIDGPILDGAMEVNRLAIARSERDGWIFATMALTVRWIAIQYGVQHALLSSQSKLAEKLYKPLGWVSTGHSFRYHPSDPEPCELLMMRPSGVHVLKSLCKTLLRSMGRGLLRKRR